MVPLKISTHILPGSPFPGVSRTQKPVSISGSVRSDCDPHVSMIVQCKRRKASGFSLRRGQRKCSRGKFGVQSHWDHTQASPPPFTQPFPCAQSFTAHKVLTHPGSHQVLTTSPGDTGSQDVGS